MSIRRWAAFLGAAGLFVWILFLYAGEGVTGGNIPATSDSTAELTEEFRDIDCSAILVIADGKDASDWPLDDDGERESSFASDGIDESEVLCDRFRDARSTQITVLSVPAVVLGVFALWGPKRRDRDVIADAAAEKSGEPVRAEAEASPSE